MPITISFAFDSGALDAVTQQLREAMERSMAEYVANLVSAFGSSHVAFAQAVPAADARASLEMGVLAHATHAEIAAVRAALRAGNIGPTSDCCVISVIAQQRGQSYARIALRAFIFERWLFQIWLGATPADCPIAAQLDAWLTAWLESHPADDATVLEIPPRVLVLDIPLPPPPTRRPHAADVALALRE